jgi:hypothetical protein
VVVLGEDYGSCDRFFLTPVPYGGGKDIGKADRHGEKKGATAML